MANFSLLARLGVDTKAFSRGLKTAQGRVRSFGKSAVGQFLKVGAAFAGIGLVKSMGSLALAAAETASKFESVFGPATSKMSKKVEELRRTIPSTTAEMQDALATFASMAKAFGLNSEAANTFSVELVKVAGDIASFHNLPIEEAFTKIRSAISGEFEPMKQLGIVINQARLEQEALNLAIFDGVGQMNAAQKALAVQSIMIRDLGTANGDAAATANSAANQVKFLKKELAETGTEIGTTLLPAITTLTGALSTMLQKIVEGTQNLGTFIGELLFMGGMDEITFKAKLDLQAEGAFEGLSGRGGTVQMQKMIEERVALMKKEEAERKKAAEERAKAREKEIQESKDLGKTLEEQIATETDPARAQALKDRLKAFNDLIKAAGDLETVEATEPVTSADSPKDVGGKDNTDEESKVADLKKRSADTEARIAQLKEKHLEAQSKADGETLSSLKERLRLEEESLSNLQTKIKSAEDDTSNQSVESEAAIADMKNQALEIEGRIADTKQKYLDAQSKGEDESLSAIENKIKEEEKLLALLDGQLKTAKEEAALKEEGIEKAKEIEGLEKKLSDMKLEALRAQARGDKEAEDSLVHRVELAEEMVNLMKEYGISQEEANLIANNTGSDFENLDFKGGGEQRNLLEGHDLKKAANIAGEGKAEDGKDIRFEKLAKGGFQQFIGGRKGEVFSEEELQKGLQKQLDKDPTEKLLERINQTLEGKFVNQ